MTKDLGVIEICKMYSVNSNAVFEALQRVGVSCQEFRDSWAGHRIIGEDAEFGLKISDLLFCDEWNGEEV